MWDGLGFFGFSDTKLPRLRGKEVTWWTPLLSMKTTPLMIISFSVAAFIIIAQAGNLGL